MKWVTCDNGRLLMRETGLTADRREGLPDFVSSLATRAVHELLFDPRKGPPPMMPALACARAALNTARGRPAVIWIDPDGTIYPPALARAGLPLDRLYLVRSKPADVPQVMADCLRSTGVAAVIAPLPARLSRPQTRRIQLAAETGGGLGLVLREIGRGSDIYAAATRWRVRPAPGDRTTQRWTAEQLHGQGRRDGEMLLLETTRAAANPDLRTVFHHQAAPARGPAVPVHSPAALADRAAVAAVEARAG